MPLRVPSVSFFSATSLCTLRMLTVSHKLKWLVHTGDPFTYTTDLDFSSENQNCTSYGVLITMTTWMNDVTSNSTYSKLSSLCSYPSSLPQSHFISHVKNRRPNSGSYTWHFNLQDSLFFLPHNSSVYQILTNNHTLSYFRSLSLFPGPRRWPMSSVSSPTPAPFNQSSLLSSKQYF